jgi:hypothetical protein
MNRREVCFLISGDGSVMWADSGSASALPDSRPRWQEIWTRRDALVEIAHSHPRGPAAFSSEDETTMAALDSALGRPLRYSVVAPSAMIARDGAGLQQVDSEPWWAALMRSASGMHEEE